MISVYLLLDLPSMDLYIICVMDNGVQAMLRADVIVF